MEKGINKKTREILDIHTHNLAKRNHSIVNYPLLTSSPLHVPLDCKADDAMGINLLYQSWVSMPPSDFSTLDMAFINKAPLLKGRYYSVGLHPWELTMYNAGAQYERLRRLYLKPQVVAIGEAGLDKQAGAPLELQIRMFQIQANLAEVTNKPLIVHCVKAMGELLAIRKEFHPSCPWIWHGFRGKPEQAEQLLKKGFYFSFGEYYNEEAMAMTPDNRLFLETDVSDTGIECLLQQAAQIRKTDPDTLRAVIRQNVEKVFFNR